MCSSDLIPFHKLALSTEAFQKGDLSTRFVEELLKDRQPVAKA